MTSTTPWQFVSASLIAILAMAIAQAPARADYATDVCDEFEQMAAKGSASAQVEIANCYIMGYGRKPDFEVAEEWLLRAMDAGSEKAPVTYAALILFKTKEESRFTFAVNLLQDKIPSSNGFPEFSLAVAYRNGLGVAEDEKQSNCYLLQSAERRHLMATFSIFGQFVLGERDEENTKSQEYWRSEFLDVLELQRVDSIDDFKRKIVNDELITTYLFGTQELKEIASEL
jgi:hypothetical protein